MLRAVHSSLRKRLPSSLKAEQGASVFCLLYLNSTPWVLIQARIIDLPHQRMPLEEVSKLSAIRDLPLHSEPHRFDSP